jgi:hypothetical protein
VSTQLPQASASTNSAIRAVSVIPDEESQENPAVSSCETSGVKFHKEEIAQGSSVDRSGNQTRTRETFAARPDFAAPHSKRNGPQSWTSCRRCSVWYAAPVSTLNRGEAVYCASRCAYAHFAETGKFKAEKNPNWLGGVSNDNMRYRSRQAERDPEKESARRRVRNAVRSGKLTRSPCEVCGVAKSEGHHDDYSKPLDVRWLCRKHHDEHHARTE